MTNKIRDLEIAIGTGGALIFSEHFFSTMLTSPVTAEKFFQTPEEQAKVRRMLFLSSGISLLAAGGISYLIKEKLPIIFTAFLCGFYILVYEAALSRRL